MRGLLWVLPGVLLFLMPAVVLSLSSAETKALQDLYNNCNGLHWNNRANWMQGDPCQWFGVGCSNSHVVSLSLGYNKLQCALPNSFWGLYMLQYLNLTANQITGGILPKISSFRSLGKIDLSHNKMVGEIPEAMGELLDYNLGNGQGVVNLAYNNFGGPVPSFFQQSSEFYSVDLSHNNFACPIPSWADWTQASCKTVTAAEFTSTGPEWGSTVILTGQRFYATQYVTCKWSGPFNSNSPSNFSGVYVPHNAVLCPSPILETVGSQSCDVISGTLTVLFDGVEVDPSNPDLSIALRYTNCVPEMTVQKISANTVTLQQMCFGTDCKNQIPNSSGGSSSQLTFHVCSSTATPSGAGMNWYHKYLSSECSNGLPSGNCVAFLTTIQDCGQMYGDWTAILPGETINGVSGPAIVWWCQVPCNDRSGYERTVSFACQ